jgi:trehalose 6-phosphate synthase
MGARLVVVSNRVAVPEAPRALAAASSAVAVKAALKNRNAVWFGWSGEVVDAARAETHGRCASTRSIMSSSI